MYSRVKVIKNLSVAIKDLKPIIDNPELLDDGRKMKPLEFTPRELLVLVLITAIKNIANDEGKQVYISTDPEEQDGIIAEFDMINSQKKSIGKPFNIEQVYVRNEEPGDVATNIIEKILQKEKKGEQYAKNRNLIVFVNKVGGIDEVLIEQNLSKFRNFESYWLIYVISSSGTEYQYAVIILKSKYEPRYFYKVNVNYSTGEYRCNPIGFKK